MSKKILFAAALIALISLTKASVLAQEELNQANPVAPTVAAEPIQEEATILQGPIPDQQQFITVQHQYLQLLEQYRIQEQTFIVSRDQYRKLNTLASQELALRDAKQLLRIRADIYITYLQMLEWIFSQTRGIPLENKSPQLVNLSLLKEQVQIHKSNISNASDRLILDAETASFVNQLKTLQAQSYFSISLIKVGRIQAALDKLIVVRNAVHTEVMSRELSAAVRSEKQRGFDEIDRNIETLHATYNPIKDEILQGRKGDTLSNLNNLSRDLGQVYSQLYQTQTLLQEVRK